VGVAEEDNKSLYVIYKAIGMFGRYGVLKLASIKMENPTR
jgi:hypothetical protein